MKTYCVIAKKLNKITRYESDPIKLLERIYFRILYNIVCVVSQTIILCYTMQKKFILCEYRCCNFMHSIKFRGIYNTLTVTTFVLSELKKKSFYRQLRKLVLVDVYAVRLFAIFDISDIGIKNYILQLQISIEYVTLCLWNCLVCLRNKIVL